MFLSTAISDSTVLLGADSVIFSIASHLDKNRFNPVIVAIQGMKGICPLIAEARKEGIASEIVYLKNKFDLDGIDKISDFIRDNNTDILHCHEYKSNIMGLLASRKRKIKVITTAHGWVKSDLKVRLYELFDAIWIRFFDIIVAVSLSRKKELMSRLIPEKKILVINNGIALGAFAETGNAEKYRRELKLRPETKVIGNIGRLTSEKGHRYLLEAFPAVLRKFPDSKLLLAGDGNLREKLLMQAKNLGIAESVFLLGYKKDIKPLLSIMDIFVFPSLTEGFPMALLEAMAMGVPVIASKVGGIPEIVKENETGILVRSKNSSEIAEAIIKLLSEQEILDRMKVKSREEVRRFSVEEMVRKYENLYVNLVDK